MICNSKELLVAFIYDELDEEDRRGVEEHLESCVACREEIAGLRSMRGQLASWLPPERDLGFQIVRGTGVPAAAPAPAPPRFRISPAWGLAAAAVLVLAVASAIANLEVRYDSNGLVVRTGWGRSSDIASADNPHAESAVAAMPVGWKADLARLDRRLVELEAAASRMQSDSLQAAGPRLSDQEVLRRVREMLNQSETRQQRDVAVRLAQVVRDVEAQRRIDLAAIDQGMNRIQSTSGAEVKQYRDLIQRLYRVVSTDVTAR